MALLKAFVCQVVLFGLYKLFLEQVVEDHLVPDELTRNCLVGFICLLCFGLQIYTDKADDDETEDPKTVSEARESTDSKKLESTEMTGKIVNEAVGLNQIMVTKTQTAWQDGTAEKKQNGVESKKGNDALSSTKAEAIGKVSHFGMFAEFSTNTLDAMPNIVDREMKEFYKAASTVEMIKTIPHISGLKKVSISEDSEESGIVIDQLASKESLEEKVEPVVKDEGIGSEYVVESVGECVTSNGETLNQFEQCASIESLDEVHLLKTDELLELDHVLNAVGECLASNGTNILSNEFPKVEPQLAASDGLIKEKVLQLNIEQVEVDETIAGNSASRDENISSTELLEAEEETEPQLEASNGSLTEVQQLKTKDEYVLYTPVQISNEEPSNEVKDMEKFDSSQDEEKLNYKKETSFSESTDYTKDITEPRPSANEIDCSSSTSNEVNEMETVVKCNQDKSEVSSTRQRITPGDVCIPPVLVDISFIYACH